MLCADDISTGAEINAGDPNLSPCAPRELLLLVADVGLSTQKLSRSLVFPEPGTITRAVLPRELQSTGLLFGPANVLGFEFFFVDCFLLLGFCVSLLDTCGFI